MKLEKLFNYDSENEPKEAAEDPLCYLVLESREEVRQILEALCPRWAYIESVEFKRGGRLAGRCERLSDGGLMTESFILKFYGTVFLTTVLHELAHVADRNHDDHDEKFKAHFRAMIEAAKKQFNLKKPGCSLKKKQKEELT
jgi:hypothetical protein